MKKFLAAVFLIFLFAACSGENDEQAEAIGQAEGSADINTPSTNKTETPLFERGEGFSADKAIELGSMNFDVCNNQDAHSFLEVEEPRVLSDGTEFQFHCRELAFGWFLPGDSTDQWRNALSADDFETRGEYHFFDTELIGLPDRLDHPGFSDEVTIWDLALGEVHCAIFEGGTTDEFIPSGHFFEGIVQFKNNEVAVQGSIVIEVVEDDGSTALRRAVDAGLHPFEGNGSWALNRVVLGACPDLLTES